MPKYKQRFVERVHTTTIFKLRNAFRKHVRRPDGGNHQIFGGGVPIIRICFKTDIVF